jgi:hypothetical protein
MIIMEEEGTPNFLKYLILNFYEISNYENIQNSITLALQLASLNSKHHKITLSAPSTCLNF